MTHRLTTNYAKNYCNRTLIVKVIVENVVTCFLGGHGVHATNRAAIIIRDVHLLKRVIFSLLSYTDDVCVCAFCMQWAAYRLVLSQYTTS